MRFAVIPTGNRPDDYANVVKWCEDHDTTVITIATSQEAESYAKGEVIVSHDFNIQKWWNLGIDRATKLGATTIAILNDDAIMPDDWFDFIEPRLVDHSGASGLRFGTHAKISGYAFALNANDGIRADERFVWWYGDDDIEQQCRNKRGFLIIPGFEVGNKYANSSAPMMRKQIRRDRWSYQNKWGIR